MSRNRVTCPDCGSRTTRQKAEAQVCWHCEGLKVRAEEDKAFESFMEHDEETRWRLLWEAAGNPTL